MAKGNVEAQPDYAARDPSNLLLGQPDGTFVESAEAAGLLSFARARGAALVDLNLDGLLDLVVVNRRENVGLWRNVGRGDGRPPRSRWATGSRCASTSPGRTTMRSVPGSRSRIGERIMRRELTVGGGHAGGQLGWVALRPRLGRRTPRSRVQWPDGEVGAWVPVEANRFATIERGASEPAYFAPHDPDGG